MEERIVIDLGELRRRNEKYSDHPGYHWLFPVRAESQEFGIRWFTNIIELFGKLRRPIDRKQWNQLLQAEKVVAATPEENDRLRRWWDEGYNNTPPIEQDFRYTAPIMKVKPSALGDSLDSVFPSIAAACEDYGCLDSATLMTAIVQKKQRNGYYYMFLRHHSLIKIISRLPKTKYWYLFDKSDRCLGKYSKLAEIAEVLGCNLKKVQHDRERHNGTTSCGHWFWRDGDSDIPTSPFSKKQLDSNWRDQILGPDQI